MATPTGREAEAPRAPPVSALRATPDKPKQPPRGKRAKGKAKAAAAPSPTSAAALRRAAATKRAPPDGSGGEGRAKPRSGSETRQRTHVARIRLDDSEAVKLEELASASGLSVGAYLRAAGLKSAGVRAKPRPSVDRELLARANADLNKVGNNINQIAHALNIGLDTPSYIAEAMQDLRGTLTAIRRAAGYDS